jgi:hypothetical protein
MVYGARTRSWTKQMGYPGLSEIGIGNFAAWATRRRLAADDVQDYDAAGFGSAKHSGSPPVRP